MRLGPQISSLRPVFRERKRFGSIEIGNTPPGTIAPPPVACFTVEIIVGIVYFDASCSTSDGTIIGWAWDFGDGDGSTDGPTTSHVYEAPGVYNVTLTVTDDLSVEDDHTDSVGIGYDEILAGGVGAIWYAVLGDGEIGPPIWKTYTEAVADQEYVNGWGPYFVEAWTDEYTGMEWPTFEQAISDDTKITLGPYWLDAYWEQSTKPGHDELATDIVGAIWYAQLDEQVSPVDWETLSEAIAADIRAESSKGNLYFEAWWNESGEAPDYQEAMTALSPLWYSTLDTLGTNNTEPMGGNSIVESGGYRYHRFTSDGSFWTGKVSGTLTVDILVVGGGGGGGGGGTGGWGGGGGAGEALLLSSEVLTDAGYAVTIGAGGTRTASAPGGNGSASTFGSYTAAGGSGGGSPGTDGGNGRSDGGGSGGGGAASSTVSGLGGTAGAGFDGGAGGGGASSSSNRAGGGGGAGAVGRTGVYATTTGVGGVGIQFPAGTYYAGGGGGAAGGSGTVSGGSGGGGSGGRNNTGATGNNASDNTGGGGGGAAGTLNPGLGGSGIVIVRYPI